ncbi:MAG: ferritin family protein [Deltaproteobacteria bacterium]|nr:ferritin family protein [Deltaproteobacteria bacterium]
MDVKLKELVEALRTAMQAERTGFEFYKMAAVNTQDASGKKVFEELAAEEQGHFEFLKQHHQSVMSAGELARGATLGEAHRLTEQHPIFSADFKARLKQAHVEMSALAIAAQLELNGINFYREQAARATLPEAKRFFQQLVEWESGHYDAFVRQQQELQESYWSEAGFSPF